MLAPCQSRPQCVHLCKLATRLQVAERVRSNPRVAVMERTNLRYLRIEDLGSLHVDLITLDLSFISGRHRLSNALLNTPSCLQYTTFAWLHVAPATPQAFPLWRPIG
jgi:predicted rRNA methylase YqxC with S4 and FtsJ domains